MVKTVAVVVAYILNHVTKHPSPWPLFHARIVL